METEEKPASKKRRYYTIGTVFILIAVGIVVGGASFLFRGEITKEGQNPNPITSDSISCSSDEVEYSFISTQPGENSHSLRVDLVFSGGKLNVAGLYYDLEYETEEEATNAIQVLTPELNLSMDRAGVENNFASNAQFSKNSNHVALKLYSNANNITPQNAKYLLIDENDLSDKEKLIEHLENQGLGCKAKQ